MSASNRKPGSFAMVPTSAIRDERLGLYFRALACIALNDRGEGCDKTVPELAREIGCNRSNLATALSELCGWGYVTSEVNPANKRQRIYRVRYDNPLPTGQPIKQSNQLPEGQPIKPDQLPKTAESVAQNRRISCPTDFQANGAKQKLGPLSDIRQESDKKKREAPASSMPDDWPNEFDRAWAVNFWREKNRPDLVETIADEAEAARNKHAEKGTRSKDWAATWRYWAQKSVEFNRQPKSSATTWETVTAHAEKVLGMASDDREHASIARHAFRCLKALFEDQPERAMRVLDIAGKQGSRAVYAVNEYLCTKAKDPEGRLNGFTIGPVQP